MCVGVVIEELCPRVCVFMDVVRVPEEPLKDGLGVMGDAEDLGDAVCGCLIVSLTAKYVGRGVISDVVAAEGKLLVNGVTGSVVVDAVVCLRAVDSVAIDVVVCIAVRVTCSVVCAVIDVSLLKKLVFCIGVV